MPPITAFRRERSPDRSEDFAQVSRRHLGKRNLPAAGGRGREGSVSAAAPLAGRRVSRPAKGIRGKAACLPTTRHFVGSDPPIAPQIYEQVLTEASGDASLRKAQRIHAFPSEGKVACPDPPRGARRMRWRGALRITPVSRGKIPWIFAQVPGGIWGCLPTTGLCGGLADDVAIHP